MEVMLALSSKTAVFSHIHMYIKNVSTFHLMELQNAISLKHYRLKYISYENNILSHAHARARARERERERDVKFKETFIYYLHIISMIKSKYNFN